VCNAVTQHNVEAQNEIVSREMQMQMLVSKTGKATREWWRKLHN
jgi:hypothetical protein